MWFVVCISCTSGNDAIDARLPTSNDAAVPNFDRLSPDCFVLDASNPVLQRGDVYAGSTWGDPHVLFVNSEYIMYASSDENFDGAIKIYRFRSSDGVDWTLSPTTPVLARSVDPNAWDRKSTETPSVVYFRDAFYMFYTGYPNDFAAASEYRVMMAKSSDGITWERQPYFIAPSDPSNTTPTLDFRQWIVAEPGAVVFGDELYVYFAALGADLAVNATLQTIGVVKSSDGVTWSEPQVALRPDQSLYPRSSNWKGYSTPAGIALNGKLHLFFNVVTDEPFEQVAIHHASSVDGIGQWQHDATAIIGREELAPWANVNVVSPTVILNGTTLLLWLSGHGDTSNFPNVTMGIGIARCSL